MADDDTIPDAITDALSDGIRKASGDQGSVEKYDADGIIKMDKYKRSVAASKVGFGGVKFTKLLPPGAE